MGVIPEGYTTTLEVTRGSEVCEEQPAVSPAPCPDPHSWEPALGEVQTYGVVQTLLQPALESRHHLFPAGMFCKDKGPLES